MSDETAEALRKQQILSAVHERLRELSEENMALHRRSAAALEKLRRDIERIERRIRRTSVARA